MSGHQVDIGGRSDLKVVLVVDDEPLVRMITADIFAELGFEVVEASGGAEALQRLEERQDISLLFSDCRMPGMSGPELAEAASRRWPGLRIILASGYVNVRPPGWPLLNKPYDAAAIRRVLNEIGGARQRR